MGRSDDQPLKPGPQTSASTRRMVNGSEGRSETRQFYISLIDDPQRRKRVDARNN